MGQQIDCDPAAFLAALPGQLTEPQVIGLTPLVASAFARGWTPHALRSHIRNRYREGEVVSPPAVYRSILQRLPAPSRRTMASRARVPIPPPCADHLGPDLPMRTREDHLGRIVKCPACHPYSPRLSGATGT